MDADFNATFSGQALVGKGSDACTARRRPLRRSISEKNESVYVIAPPPRLKSFSGSTNSYIDPGEEPLRVSSFPLYEPQWP
jgi:hypothetical protein